MTRSTAHLTLAPLARGVRHVVVALAIVVALARPASAQEMVVLVTGGTTDGEREAIAAALRNELGLDVHHADDASDDTFALRVAITGRRARLVVTRPGRARILRTVVLPRDVEARSHTLVTLAINLTRDEAAELLARLRRLPATAETNAGRTEGVSVEDAEEPSVRSSTSESASDSNTRPPEDSGGSEPATVGSVASVEANGAGVEANGVSVEADGADAPDASPAEASAPDEAAEAPAATETAARVEEDGERDRDPWRHRWLRVGVGAHLGTAPEVGGDVVPWALIGTEVTFAPMPEFAFGLRELNAIEHRSGVVVTASPVVEGALRVHRHVAVHAILGCDVQVAPAEQGTVVGAAPRLGLGARVFVHPAFSIAMDVTGRAVATDVLYTVATPLPSGSIAITGALSLAFHIDEYGM